MSFKRLVEDAAFTSRFDISTSPILDTLTAPHTSVTIRSV